MNQITVDETTQTYNALGKANGYSFIVHGLESWTDARALADAYMELIKAQYNICLTGYEIDAYTVAYSVEFGKSFPREVIQAGDTLKADYLKSSVAAAVKKLRERVIQSLAKHNTPVVVHDEDHDRD